MNLSKTDLEKYEDEVKKSIFKWLSIIIPIQDRFISYAQNIREIVGIDNNSLPNIGTRINNKILEISHEFQNNGISMYANSKEEIVDINMLGGAILYDFIDKANECKHIIEKYMAEIENVVKECAKYEKMKQDSTINGLLRKIKNIFLPKKVLDVKKKILECEKYISHYKKICEQVTDFNLEKNLVESLVNYLMSSRI